MIEYELSDYLKKILKKLSKKDKMKYEAVMTKIREVINSSDVEHYKNLMHDLKEFKLERKF